jgi:hypothetical protein
MDTRAREAAVPPSTHEKRSPVVRLVLLSVHLEAIRLVGVHKGVADTLRPCAVRALAVTDIHQVGITLPAAQRLNRRESACRNARAVEAPLGSSRARAGSCDTRRSAIARKAETESNRGKRKEKEARGMPSTRCHEMPHAEPCEVTQVQPRSESGADATLSVGS